MFKQMTIIGVGLIGGSLARAAKKQGLVETIIGSGRDARHLQTALDLGVIDKFELDLAQSVKGSDIVILAVPMGAMLAVMQTIKNDLHADAILSDVGSAKQAVIGAAQQVFSHLPGGFIPGHPIAGTEQSGVEASFDSLYENRCVILTPLETSSELSKNKLSQLWQGVGANVVMMDAKHHDEVLAATSHVPHVLAFALVDTLGQMNEHAEIFRFAAGGFRDFTRIASSDTKMWRDICLENSEAVVQVLDRFNLELEKLRQAIAKKDSAYIETIFARAKTARDNHIIG
ncbi:MAG: prephenate dehydrogenase/arogenate dehydrogenase family protein [Gammaproteobacteria bacterium]|nr:prephenate dehydrogenase/arogenate dehydrogenase family protein [Gammaproteobacteria bacterium]